MPLSKEQFESGMNTQQYIDQIKVNKDPFVEIYNSVELLPMPLSGQMV